MRKIIPLLLFLLCANVVVGQFGPKMNISGSISFPLDVKSFDVDGDGDMDVLTASEASNDSRVAWYENLGNDQFTSQQIIAYTLYPDTTQSVYGARSIYASDIDNDGDLDVIVGCKIINKIAWYENKGGQIDTVQRVITTSALGVESIHVIDIDNDGDVDVLSASFNDNKIAWYENLGNGIFGSQQIISTNANGASSVHASDIDGDGDMDVLSASVNDDKIAWYENLGAGIFGTQQIISNMVIGAHFVYSMDIDGDNDPDVLLGGSSKLVWFENQGGIFDTTQQVISTVVYPESLYPEDMDGDTDIDIVVGSKQLGFSNRLVWFENLGGGIIDTTQNIVSSDLGTTNAVYASDLDNDGDYEIFSASRNDSQISWYKNLGGGVFDSKRIIVEAHSSINTFDISDFDLDGDKDVLTGSNNEVLWYENLGGGKFRMKKIIDYGGSGARAVYSTDLDNDGDKDVLVAGYAVDKISWYENLNGIIDTTQQLISTAVISVKSLFAIDLDNDGDQDVLSASVGDDKIAWYENLGGGIFGVQQVISNNANGASSVYSFDVDNDGDQDVLSASQFDDKIAWYENLGGGIFGVQQVISNNADGASSVYSFDIDNDGDEDVFSTSINNGKVSWYENLGGVIDTIENVISSTFSSATSLNASDLDLDGDDDLLVSSYALHKISWYENLGGVFNTTENIISSKARFAIKIMTADIDNDGDQDVFFGFDNEVAWYKNYFYDAYQIKGSTFYDTNQNGVKDSNDIGLSFIQTKLQPSGIANFTDNTGNYFFSINDTSSYYTVSYLSDSLWNLTTDSASYIRFLTSANPIVDSLDFGFYPDTIIDKINTEIIGSFPRCNDTINYWLDVKNNGTTIPSGVIHLQLDDSVSYVGASIIPDSINGQNLYWHYDSLFYFTNTQINLQVLMPDFNSIGDSLTSYLNVSVIDTSENQVFLASDTLNPILVCAYDPNDKIADPVGIDSLGYISANTEYVEYTVRFQNTGNDTAVTVNILDQLDTNLVWNTLIPLASSHPLQIDVDQTGEITFKFENILLPDSGSDFLGSQGFVKYKINLKPNLVPGTSIFNTAHIYFDQNPAVITNTKIYTIYDCTGFVQNTVPLLNVCQNDTISGFASDDLSTTEFTWSISNIHSSTGSNFTWIADTSGIFNLILSATNNACSKDTTIVLNVNAPFLSNQNVSICQGDSMLIYGSYQSIAGTYYDSLQTINGCDSVLTTTLFLNANFNSNQNQEICQGDSILIYGSYQNTSGVYYDSLQTINGCDSVLSTTLTVNSLPNVTLSNFNPDTICSNSNAVTLPNGSPSGGVYSGTGVNSGTFDPNIAGVGTHNVIYTYTDINSCINSDSTFITVEQCVGIADLANDLGILIYPNPNTGLFTIEKPMELDKEVNISLLDASSRVVINKIILKGQQKIEMDITSYSKGVYYLQMTIGDKVYVKQILKN